MLKQTVNYEDFDGKQQTEELYFNLSKSEMIDLEAAEEGKLSERLDRARRTNSTEAAYRELKDVIIRAYGRKSPDGRKFIKNDEIREDFVQSAVYDEFIWQLFKDVEKLTAFINGIIPQKALKEALELQESRKIQLEGETPATPVKPEPKKEEPEVGTFGQPLEEKSEPTPEEMRQKLKEAGLL